MKLILFASTYQNNDKTIKAQTKTKTIGLITVFDAILRGRQNRSVITVFVWESESK